MGGLPFERIGAEVGSLKRLEEANSLGDLGDVVLRDVQVLERNEVGQVAGQTADLIVAQRESLQLRAPEEWLRRGEVSSGDWRRWSGALTLGRSRMWFESRRSSSRVLEYLKISSGTLARDECLWSTYSTWRVLRNGMHLNILATGSQGLSPHSANMSAHLQPQRTRRSDQSAGRMRTQHVKRKLRTVETREPVFERREPRSEETMEATFARAKYQAQMAAAVFLLNLNRSSTRAPPHPTHSGPVAQSRDKRVASQELHNIIYFIGNERNIYTERLPLLQ